MESRPYLAAFILIGLIVLLLTLAMFGSDSPEVQIEERAIELFDPELTPEIEELENLQEVKKPSDFETNLSPETQALRK